MSRCRYIILFSVIVFLVFAPVKKNYLRCFATESESSTETTAEGEQNTEKLLLEEVVAQLESFDFSEIDELIKTENNFNSKNFVELVLGLISGEDEFGLDKVVSIGLELLKENITLYLSLFISIIAISFLSSIGGELSNKKSATVSGAVSMVFYAIVAILICAIVSVVISEVVGKISLLSRFVEILFPILLTCLVSVGANSSVVLLQPSILYVVSFLVVLVTKFLVPIIIVGFVLKIVGNLSDNFNLSKLNSFITSLFKWSIGLTFTIFIGILSLKGLTASSADNISIKTAKYAIRSYIPLIGGFLSDGFEVFRAGSVLIKNAIGVVAVLVLFVALIGTVVKILVLNLALKFTAGIVEPLGSSKISKFLSSVSGTFVQLVVVLMSIFFAVFVLILIVLSVGNAVV